MLATKTYMTRQQRANFANKNGGAKSLRAEFPVIAALIETNLMLDLLVDAYEAGESGQLASLAYIVRRQEAEWSQLMQKGLERIKVQADFDIEVAVNGKLTHCAKHALCGFVGTTTTDFAMATAERDAHTCPDPINCDLQVLSRGARIALSKVNRGVNKLRCLNPAPAALLLGADMLDEFMDALDSADDEALDLVVSGIREAEDADATRPFTGNDAFDADGDLVAKG